MKLYYGPGACSIVPHVALREAGLPVDLVRVDFMRGKVLPDGRALSEVHPKGYVPVLELDDGAVLTENIAILEYIADQKPESKLAPANGTLERVRLREWLSFIATELHKGVGPFFSRAMNDEFKAFTMERLKQRFGVLTAALEGKPWLMGDDFTVADAYALYPIRIWQDVVKVDPSEQPALTAYRARIEARPAVQAALAAEKG